MNIGDLWEEAEGFDNSEYLFNTVDQFAITLDVLNGYWKIYYRPGSKSKWAIGESPKAVDIETVDGRWSIR